MTIIKKRMVSVLVAAATVAAAGTAALSTSPVVNDMGFNVMSSAAQGIGYINAAGQMKNVTSYTTIKSSSTTLKAGWYVVKGKVTISSRVRITGDVNIILTDGSSLTAKGGFAVNSGCEVNIFGQEAGTGALYAGTTNGSDATASTGYCGFGGKDTTINIAGGKVFVKGGGSAAGIYAGTINLCWDNFASSVFASSFKGTVNFLDTYADAKSGTAFGPGKVNGSTIGKNVTLSAAAPIDRNTTYLEDGVYIASGNVTVSDRMTVAGSVDIILAKNATLKATEGITVSFGDKLNIWGQGKLYAGSSAGTPAGYAGIGDDDSERAGTITINGGTITAVGGKNGAGIGGDDATVEIKGGYVRAEGGRNASGIGNAYGEYGAAITISGGNVEGIGGAGGAGIGSADSAKTSKITLSYTDKTDSIYASSYSGSITFLRNMYLDETGELAKASNMNGKLIVPTAKTTYTVTFNTNGGSSIAQQYVAAGKYAKQPAKPTKAGYKFNGWYTDQYLTRPFSFNTAINSNITLYAEWVKDSFTIQFNTNGGNYLYPMYVSEGDYMATPETPYKSGYTFGGWYTDKALTKEFNYRSTRIYKDYTLYAKWVGSTHTITFNSMGGSKVKSIKVEDGDAPSQIDFDFPTRSGYIFDGWYWDKDCTDLYEKTNIFSDITLYAGWTSAAEEHKIKFNSKGGTAVQNLTVLDGDFLPVGMLPTPTRSGYTFEGWYTDSNCYYLYDGEYIYSDLTLYAGWTANAKTYKITFMGTGDSYIEPVYVSEGDIPFMPRDPQRSGYIFTGWYEDQRCTRMFDSSYGVYKDYTLYGGWESISVTHTITFNSMGGSSVRSITLDDGDAPSQNDFDFPTRSGYKFDGWYWDRDCTDKYTKTNIYSDVTLYAGWTSLVTTHSIRFNTNGGSGVSNMNVDDGDYVSVRSLPTPTRSGYKFTGWFVDSRCTMPYTDEYIYSDTVLYAGWEEDAPITHTIMFSTQGGSYVAPIQVADRGFINEYSIPDPEKSGYVFEGWFMDSMCNRRFSFGMAITSDMTLYAGWTSEYAASFDDTDDYDDYSPYYGTTFNSAGLIAGIAGGVAVIGGVTAAVIVKKKKNGKKEEDTDKKDE